jgi:hypothetical protein
MYESEQNFRYIRKALGEVHGNAFLQIIRQRSVGRCKNADFDQQQIIDGSL